MLQVHFVNLLTLYHSYESSLAGGSKRPHTFLSSQERLGAWPNHPLLGMWCWNLPARLIGLVWDMEYGGEDMVVTSVCWGGGSMRVCVGLWWVIIGLPPCKLWSALHVR